MGKISFKASPSAQETLPHYHKTKDEAKLSKTLRRITAAWPVMDRRGFDLLVVQATDF